jgi:hypothetical protein
MTIDEAIADALNKTSIRSGLMATYAIRRDGKFFGYVEAHLNTHGSTAPADWEMTWVANWQNDKGRIETSSATDLETLLKPFGNIDLTPAWADAPSKGPRRTT